MSLADQQCHEQQLLCTAADQDSEGGCHSWIHPQHLDTVMTDAIMESEMCCAYLQLLLCILCWDLSWTVQPASCPGLVGMSLPHSSTSLGYQPHFQTSGDGGGTLLPHPASASSFMSPSSNVSPHTPIMWPQHVHFPAFTSSCSVVLHCIPPVCRQFAGRVTGREVLQGSDWVPDPVPSQDAGLSWLCMGPLVAAQTIVIWPHDHIWTEVGYDPAPTFQSSPCACSEADSQA